MMDGYDAELSAALVAWLGWRDPAALWPTRDERRLVSLVGRDRARQLLPTLHKLADEFFESDARHRTADVTEMFVVACEEFRQRHPELTDDAIKALGSEYAYTYK